MIGNIQYITAKACSIFTILNYTSSTLRVYSGTIAATANGYTPEAYTANLLLTYNIAGAAYGQTSNKRGMYLATFPSAIAATGSGTATWFALNVTGLSGNYPYLIDEASDINGTKILKFLTTNIVSGTSYDIASFGFELTH